MVKILRVFPTKTKATPDDENVRFGEPGFYDKADEVHISVTFTWDIKKAKYLASQWESIAPVKIGGPGSGQKGEQFMPGMYLRNGYVITSRGCPNKCWFCDVWKRDGSIRELEIKNGWNVLDDNLLACSDQHIKNVFEMLRLQSNIEFTGGFEATRFKEWHIDELLKLRLKQVFFAYDTPNDYEPLLYASELLKNAGLIRNSSHAIRCYVLIGYPNDTFEKAEQRLKAVIKLGYMPMAMLYRDHIGKYDLKWKRFQRQWANPTIIAIKFKEYRIKTW